MKKFKPKQKLQPYGYRFLKAFFLMREFPKGLLFVFGILSFLISYSWDQKVVKITSKNVRTSPVDSLLAENQLAKMKNDRMSCKELSCAKLYLFQYDVENITLDGSKIDSIYMELLYASINNVLIADYKLIPGFGLLRPKVTLEDSCAELQRVKIVDLQPGNLVELFVLTNSKQPPTFYSEYISSEFKVETGFGFHSLMSFLMNHFTASLSVVLFISLIYLMFTIRESLKS
ncbi:MAG: hypothetical protein ACMVP2_26045 [Imperialibacter sp.]|uniref:hypothetical protein n=1 Tax=Imperialibacter sp. TaxID=2038411 RepID=UPI003A8800CD